MTHVTLETDGALAIVTLDNPPQNRIGDQMADELAGIVEAIEFWRKPRRFAPCERNRL